MCGCEGVQNSYFCEQFIILTLKIKIIVFQFQDNTGQRSGEEEGWIQDFGERGV